MEMTPFRINSIPLQKHLPCFVNFRPRLGRGVVSIAGVNGFFGCVEWATAFWNVVFFKRIDRLRADRICTVLVVARKEIHLSHPILTSPLRVRVKPNV